MSKTKQMSLAVIVLLVTAAGVGYWQWTRSVTYSLRQIESAIQTNDISKFEKHVDVDSVTAKLIDDALGYILKSVAEADSQTELEQLGTMFAAGMVELMKPRLVKMAREQIVRFIETGRFDDPAAGEQGGRRQEFEMQDVAELLGVSEGDFSGKRSIVKDGKVALVAFGFRHASLGEDLELDLKFREKAGYWQLIEFANLAQLLTQIDELKRAKLADLNKPIKERIAAVLSVASATTKSKSDPWGIEKVMDLRLSVRNSAEVDVIEYAGVVRFVDRSGETLMRAPITRAETIAPASTGDGKWTIDVGLFDSRANRLHGLQPGEVEIDVEFDRVVFRDGTEIRLVESLGASPHIWEQQRTASFSAKRPRLQEMPYEEARGIIFEAIANNEVPTFSVRTEQVSRLPGRFDGRSMNEQAGAILEKSQVFWYGFTAESPDELQLFVFLDNTTTEPIHGVVFELTNSACETPGRGRMFVLDTGTVVPAGHFALLTAEASVTAGTRPSGTICGTIKAAF